MSVRDVEVRLATLEDRILDRLGYREYSLTVNGTLINILPGVEHKNISSYSQEQLRGFADKLGGQGNPISLFKLKISREVPESTLREFGYWVLSRDGYTAECLPLDISVQDARYTVLLGVIKQSG